MKDLKTAQLPQLQDLTVKELKAYAKELRIKGYSTARKSELISLVWNASAYLRLEYLEEQRLAEEAKDSATVRSSNFKSGSTLTLNMINAFWNETNQKYLENEAAKYDYSKQKNLHHWQKERINSFDCSKHLAGKIFSYLTLTARHTMNTVIRRDTAQVQKLIKCSDIPKELQEVVIREWKDILKPLYEQDNLNKMIEASTVTVKTIPSKEILDFARTNLGSDNEYINALCLSLTSGRRMGEIYGEAKYNLFNDDIILVDGLLKKRGKLSDKTIFIPLVDAKDWLDALNKLPRNLDTKKINGSKAKLISRHFPVSLKDLQVLKFKDCRDFYNSVIYDSLESELGRASAAKISSVCLGHRSVDLAVTVYAKFKSEPQQVVLDKVNSFQQALRKFYSSR